MHETIQTQSIPEFCKTNGISPSFFYKLQRQGKGPRLTGVFFFLLTNTQIKDLDLFDKGLLIFSLVFFVLTIALCLIELRIDAKRFYYLAHEIQKPTPEQNWDKNKRYKELRFLLLHGTYWTLGLAVISLAIYLIKALL